MDESQPTPARWSAWAAFAKARWARLQRHPRWTEPHPRTRHPVWFVTLERGLLLFALALFGTGLAATIAASLGLFRWAAPLLILGWAAALLALAWRGYLGDIRLLGDRYDILALGIGLVAALSSGAFHHLYFAAHSDVGFYVSDAFVIAETGGRTISGAYDAQLPGFESLGDGRVRVNALFGYTSLGALFAYVGGVALLPWVNAPLAFTTPIALYLVGRRLGATMGALFGPLFYITCLLTVWFGRWIMTEDLATAIFWIAILLALPLLRKWDGPRAAALGMTLTYGVLVRLELTLFAGWLVLVLLAAHARPILAFLREGIPRLARSRARWPVLGATVAVLLAFILVSVSVANDLPRNYISQNFELATQLFSGRPAADAFDVPTTGPHPNWGDYALRYEWDSTRAYGLHWFLLVAALGLALGIASRKETALVALLCIPYLLFVMMPPVTTQHPWFMRRLWVALVPLVFVFAAANLDLRRAAFRWPVHKGESVQGRALTVLGALLVTGLLLAVNLGVSGPVLLKRESDGSNDLVPFIASKLKDDPVISIDLNLVAYASPLRLQYDVPVIAWFQQQKAAYWNTFQADEDHAHMYVLRVKTPNEIPFLLPGEGGINETYTRDALFASPPRANFRDYLTYPPLEQGYAPLAKYLREDVPPNDWERSKYTVTLVETKKPLVLQHNLIFAPGEWVRTKDGMDAQTNPARLLVDPNLFKPEFRSQTKMALYLVFPQLDTVPRSLTAHSDGQAHPLLPPIEGDGSGSLTLVGLPLPQPMNVTRIDVPQGTVLRGIYLGVNEG